MLMYVVAEPPVFVAVMVNIVRSSSCIGVPLIVPVAVSKDRPSGILGLTTQETISPAPVNIASSGKSLLAVLLDRVKSSGW